MDKIYASKNIHVMGIGGIRVSAVAKLLHAYGAHITGCDLTTPDDPNITALHIPLTEGHDPKHIAGADYVVHSEAIRNDETELLEARRTKHARVVTDGEILGEITQDKKLIAVAGTHGKSTTTAMIGSILAEAGRDPTVIVGSKVPAWNGNLRIGKSELFVLEADEYRRTFLHYAPYLSAVTNVELDHLDYFRDLSDYQRAFWEFLGNVREEGSIAYNADDIGAAQVVPNASLKANVARIAYGTAALGVTEEKVEKTIILSSIEVFPGKQMFRVTTPADDLGEFSLRIPGRFNVYNALAAIACTNLLGVDVEVARKTLSEFPGIWRRFERIGVRAGISIVSDYAHHPAALVATLVAAREFYPDKKILAVFQPHQHNRTKKLFADFVHSLRSSPADRIVVSEIYRVPGRVAEEDIAVSSKDLVKAVGKSSVSYGGNLVETARIVKAELANFDMVIFMGAGDIDGIARELAHNPTPNF